jgi:hypothetical protein
VDERQQRVKVWDLPLRLFHWTLVVAIALAFLSSEEDHHRRWKPSTCTTSDDCKGCDYSVNAAENEVAQRAFTSGVR